MPTESAFRALSSQEQSTKRAFVAKSPRSTRIAGTSRWLQRVRGVFDLAHEFLDDILQEEHTGEAARL